jgi:hypothetical protein
VHAVAVISALVSLAFPGVVLAAEVFRFVDQFAIAGFRSTDPSGCIQTTVLLVTGRDIDHEPPGAPTRTSGASLRITQFDRCTSTFVSGSGFVSGVESSATPRSERPR